MFARSLVALVALCPIGLGGCSMTLPVRGMVQNSDEVFSGSATGYPDGSGTVTVTSNKGAWCEGKFVYVTSRNGSGTFFCNDGRSGPFHFVSTGTKGTGYGTLGSTTMTFEFGD